MRQYGIINLASFDEAAFQNSGGLLTSSFSTMRRSLDGNLGLVSWSGEAPPVALLPHLLVECDLDEVAAYLQQHQADWVSPFPP